MSSKAKNDTAAAAGTTLLYHHLFGLDVGVTPSVMYVDETTLCYAAGHNVVMYNTDSHRQRVFSGLDNTKAVTALALAPRKNMIAIAERGDRALVSIYDTATGKRRKQLSTSEIGSTAIVSMDFSEHKTLVTMGGAPDWTLVLWAYDKGKVLATGKVSNANASPISRVSFCPFDHHVLCVSGETILKFFRVQDGVLKMLNPSLGKHEPINYQDHAWLPENRVVVTTDTGELRFYENYELKNEMATGEDSAIMCSVVGFSKGFICGGEGGQIRVFERSDDGRDPFKHAVTLDIGGRSSNARVVGMCISPSEETLVVTTDDNQMYLTQLANLDIVKSEDSSFTVMGTPLHAPSVSGTRTITGMDVCIRKPLIVTCGADKSVRVWNYLNKSMDLTAYFEEDPTSCAMHPSGLHVLVGFTDKLRLMNLLLDDIRPCREFSVKSCVDCTFSKGGHLFAATTGNAINIYDYYTFECIAQLRGHNQKVLRVQFENDERTLVSAGMDGSVIRWDITEGRRIAEFVQKGVVFTDVLPAPGGKVVTMGSDRLLKVIEFNPDNTGSATTEMDVDVQLGCVALTKSGKSLLAAGTDLGRPGTVRAYAFPLTGHYVEYQAHSGPVTRIRLSFDDQYCFTVGADGTLAAFNIREPAAGKGGKGARDDKRGAGGAHDALPFAEETLVTRSDLEEKKAKMAELHAKVDELQLHNEYQLRRKDIKYSEKIQEVTEKFTQELEAGRQKYDLLTEEKEDMRLEYTYKIESLEAKQTREIEEMQRNYKGKIDAEVSRYNELEEERDRLNREWDEKNEMVVESHQTYIQDLTESYEQKLRQEEEERQRIAEQKELLMRGFAERKKSIDDDADREIEDYKRKYELKLAAEKEATLRLKGENGIMRKKFSALQKDIEDQREEIKGLLEKQQQLYEKIKGLEKDIQGHKKEINEREETIQDKEKRIYDLKKKNQELEKFKFVLDYKIKELKRQIEPRENEIADMAQQIKEMDQELEQYHKSNAALDLMIGELKLKMEGMQQEIDIQKATLTDGEALIARITSDLEDMIGTKKSHKSLKKSVVKLYRKYIQDDLAMNKAGGGGGGGGGGESDVQSDYNRQREYLEKSVESLKRKLAKDMELHRNENTRLMRESVSLTQEINDLRRELHIAKALRAPRNGMGGGNPGGPAMPAPGTRMGGGSRATTASQGMTPAPPSTGGSSRREAWSSARNTRLSAMDAQRELQMQQQQLVRIRSHIARMEDAVGGPVAREGLQVPQFPREEYL